MKTINISAVVSQGWELTKKNWMAALACLVLSYVASFIVQMLLTGNSAAALSTLQNPSNDPVQQMAAIGSFYASMAPAIIASGIVSLIVMVGVYQTFLNCARDDSEFSFQAWNQPAAVYAKIVVTEFIVSVITYIGVMLCILPGLYLYARLQYAPLYLLDHKNAGIGEALSASWNKTSASAFSLCGLVLLYVLFGIIGLLCCCVGVIVAAILIYFCIVVCYLTLIDDEPSAEVTD